MFLPKQHSERSYCHVRVCYWIFAECESGDAPPLHGVLSNGMTLITVTRCKTGKKYTTPVGYYREGNSLWVIASREGTWWRNLQGGAKVGLLLKRTSAIGFAETTMEQHEVEARLSDYIQHIPQSARGFGIRMENGKPNADDIARVAEDRLFIKIQLA